MQKPRNLRLCLNTCVGKSRAAKGWSSSQARDLHFPMVDTLSGLSASGEIKRLLLSAGLWSQGRRNPGERLEGVAV